MAILGRQLIRNIGGRAVSAIPFKAHVENLSHDKAQKLTQMDFSDAATKNDEKIEEEPLWKDPYKHALPEQHRTYSGFREVAVRWDYVRRLLPRRLIPEIPQCVSDEGVTPSGWRAPRESAPSLPYYIKRKAGHLPGIYLERRRDELNPKTMDFEYVELVILTGIDGDVFACERDLRAYLEKRLCHPIATHIDEIKGKIKIKGVDRTLVEQFVYDYEKEFCAAD